MENNIALEASIPANNKQIIEIYNKLRSEQLIVNKNYQRKLVWKRAHKLNFIDTVLRNYPFPEVYLAPGTLDQEKLILIDEIVDGQQRLTTIRDYIEGKDVFALQNLSIKKFSELDTDERNRFLNYEVSVRYLKNVTPDQVREIFQRINKTDYALTATERINAQWGDSEFVCFCKQLVEKEFFSDNVQYILNDEDRREIELFFHGDEEDDDSVFTSSDLSRMYALQYIMSLIVTMDCQIYFSRNEKLKLYIEGYNESFLQADELKDRLLKVIRFVKTTPISRSSRWYKKANLFSLIIELDKVEIESINPNKLGAFLNELDRKVLFDELGISGQEDALTTDERRYFELAREAVNQKSAREYRGRFINNLITMSRNTV